MQFEFQESSGEGNWATAGSWFTSFAALGILLSKMNKSQSPRIVRILISAPRKEFISAAIAFGISIHKLNTKESILKEISHSDLVNQPANSKMRLVLDVGHLDVLFHEYYPERKEIRCTINGLHKTRKQHAGKVNKIYLLPNFYPEGVYLFSPQDYEKLDKSSEKETWRTQGAPGVAIFGDLENIKMQTSTQIRNSLIAGVVGKETLTLEDAARLDQLDGHSQSSFINTYASTSEFSKLQIVEDSIINFFDWVILDGNNAINRLCASENLIDRSVLSILELGVPRSQGKALGTFTSELNRYSSVDVTKLTGWNPPAGVNIWGWAK